jgi:3-oxoacyl-[acyl-carrier-protein] synthase II
MNRVFITGVGCITPLGNNVETLWNNIKNGACGIDFIKKIDATDLPVKIAAESKTSTPKSMVSTRP